MCRTCFKNKKEAKKYIESQEILSHYSRKASIKNDGWEDGLTYTDNEKKADCVAVYVQTRYKERPPVLSLPKDTFLGCFDIDEEKEFFIDKNTSLIVAKERASKYVKELETKYPNADQSEY